MNSTTGSAAFPSITVTFAPLARHRDCPAIEVDVLDILARRNKHCIAIVCGIDTSLDRRLILGYVDSGGQPARNNNYREQR
jgi:hypothetical protein